MKRVQSRSGFTLIELLVVIAIIAILAAILFPVFAKAREKARQTKCTSNQRQIALAAQMYTQENDETFPTADSFWTSLTLDSKGILVCPSKGSRQPNGYVFNSMLSGVSLGMIANPSDVPLTADGKVTTSGTVQNVAYASKDVELRHGGKTIQSYADGHVELTKTSMLVVNWASTTKADPCLVTATYPGTAGSTLQNGPYSDWWRTGACSAETLYGNGALSFTVPETGKNYIVGLAKVSRDNTELDTTKVEYMKVNYALFVTNLLGGDKAAIIELGALKPSSDALTTVDYVANDTFTIQRKDGVISYWKGNTKIYTSATSSNDPLYVQVWMGSDDGEKLTNIAFTSITQ